MKNMRIYILSTLCIAHINFLHSIKHSRYAELQNILDGAYMIDTSQEKYATIIAEDIKLAIKNIDKIINTLKTTHSKDYKETLIKDTQQKLPEIKKELKQKIKEMGTRLTEISQTELSEIKKYVQSEHAKAIDSKTKKDIKKIHQDYNDELKKQTNHIHQKTKEQKNKLQSSMSHKTPLQIKREHTIQMRNALKNLQDELAYIEKNNLQETDEIKQHSGTDLKNMHIQLLEEKINELKDIARKVIGILTGK